MDALTLIRNFEGFKETPYWDVNALRTGYGSDTVTLADGTVQPVGKDTRVTREDADRDLARRVQTEFMPRAAKAVGEDIFAALPDNQKAALTSIAYNYGTLPSNVAKAVRSGDPANVASAIRALAKHNDGVNADRRNMEASVFLGGRTGTGGGADSGQAANYEAPKPIEKNPLRLAWAYRNGKMTPEDAALYERGLSAGAFGQPKEQATEEPSPLDTYQSIAMRPSRPLQGYNQQQFSMPQAWGGLGAPK